MGPPKIPVGGMNPDAHLGANTQLNAVTRFFSRLDMVDTVSFSKDSSEKLMMAIESYESKRKTTKGPEMQALKKSMVKDISDIMKADTTAKGIVVKGLNERLIFMQGHELRGFILVSDHKDDLRELQKLYDNEEIEAQEVYVKLQELAQLREVPFEWIVGQNHAAQVRMQADLVANMVKEKVPPAQAVAKLKRLSAAFIRRPLKFTWWVEMLEAEKVERTEMAELMAELMRGFKPVVPNTPPSPPSLAVGDKAAKI